MPIKTSQSPMIISQVFGSKNGSHETVLSKSDSAGEMPKGFKIPNQIKIIPREIRRAKTPQFSIKSEILRSRFSKLNFIVLLVCLNIYLFRKPNYYITNYYLKLSNEFGEQLKWFSPKFLKINMPYPKKKGSNILLFEPYPKSYFSFILFLQIFCSLYLYLLQ